MAASTRLAPVREEESPEPEQLIDNLGDDSEEIIPFRYSVTSYGADYPVDSLVKRIEDGSIYIPSFQRQFVWTLNKASRFIESLLLGLPVPGIFLSKEAATQKLLVIDGSQRLRTLQYFYRGLFSDTGREFGLAKEVVQSQFRGATYRSLSDEDRRRLDDSILHATIVRQEEPSDDESSIYHIFERLNTGGVLLQPQEIRASIYHGPFSDLLGELNRNARWRELYGNLSPRMRDQELILRFFALFFRSENYEKPMKEFLNRYMGVNRSLSVHPAALLTKLFDEAVVNVSRGIGQGAFKPRGGLNAAVCDSVLVGVARRLAKGSVTGVLMRDRYDELLKNRDYTSATEKGTADELNVRKRLELASDSFATLP